MRQPSVLVSRPLKTRPAGLAKLMFRQSKLIARVRDLAMRVVSVDRAIKPIQRLLQHPADPDAVAASVIGSSVSGRTSR